MFRSKGKLSHGMRNMSSSLLTLNEIESLGKSSDWRKHYIIKPKEIGRGHFSKVYHVTCENRKKSFAAKVIRRRRGGIDRLEKIKEEAELIRKLNNLGVQSVIQLFETYENFSEVVLISELAKGGSLFSLVQESRTGLSPNFVKIVIFKLLLALEAMHMENIVHLDIKADNILLREPYPSTDIALCDFGLATQLKIGKSHKELVGTPDYMAPEVINYEKVSVNADMWSVGVVVYYLLTGQSPFMGTSKDETLSNVSRVNITFDEVFSQPEFKIAKDFILSLCVKLPESRLSSTDAMKHSWFSNIDDIISYHHNFDLINNSDENTDYEQEENNEFPGSIDIIRSPRTQRWSTTLENYKSFKLRPLTAGSCENIFINDFQNDFCDTNKKLMNVEEVNDEIVNDSSSNNHFSGISSNYNSMDGILVGSTNDGEKHDRLKIYPTDVNKSSFNVGINNISSICSSLSPESDLHASSHGDDSHKLTNNGLDQEVECVDDVLTVTSPYSDVDIRNEESINSINARDSSGIFQGNHYCPESSGQRYNVNNDHNKRVSKVRLQIVNCDGNFVKELDRTDSCADIEPLTNLIGDQHRGSDLYLDICTNNDRRYSSDTNEMSIVNQNTQSNTDVSETSDDNYSIFGYRLSSMCTLC